MMGSAHRRTSRIFPPQKYSEPATYQQPLSRFVQNGGESRSKTFVFCVHPYRSLICIAPKALALAKVSTGHLRRRPDHFISIDRMGSFLQNEPEHRTLVCAPRAFYSAATQEKRSGRMSDWRTGSRPVFCSGVALRCVRAKRSL